MTHTNIQKYAIEKKNKTYKKKNFQQRLMYFEK